MRVNITHATETRGLMFKTEEPVVHVDVEFTPEEIQAIDRLKMRKQVLIRRTPNTRNLKKFSARDFEELHDTFYLRVEDLIKHHPDSFAFDKPLQAADYEKMVLEQLKELKSILNDGGLQSKTVEI